MPYIPLQPLDIKINSKAKDINIVEYNSTMAKLKTYLDQLNTNMQATVIDDAGEVLPEVEERVEGSTFVVLED